MQSKNLAKEIDRIISFLTSESESISTNILEFGYRERIRIERCLFLLIKTLCKKEIDYDLQGFSNNHIEKLTATIANRLSRKTFNLIISQAFQMKIYLQTLSNANAYVRGDALSKLGLNKKSVFKFIQEQIKSIIDKMDTFHVQQLH
jgi:hypothetical protein